MSKLVKQSLFTKALQKGRSAVRLLNGRPSAKLKTFHGTVDRELLSNEEIMAFMRHDAHRIEKAFYNRIFEGKRGFYEQRRDNVIESINILRSRGVDMTERTIVWAEEIAHHFDDLPEKFIQPKSSAAKPINLEGFDNFLQLVASRRSSRVWASDQPQPSELVSFAHSMIDAARWAPNSGDRQPIRYKIIVDKDEKFQLAGLKEEHCYAAPCIIFVGVDRRFYGGLGHDEAGIYIDAGCAAMQMVLAAHASNYGVCWNHFSRDLIESRESNIAIYNRWVERQAIPHYIEPIAIIAFGVAAFHPPVPARIAVEDLLI